MRTTVTLDPDVEVLVRQRMKERDLSFKEALNSALRSALGGSEDSEPFRQRTFAMGFRPEFQIDKALAIAGALEDEEILRKLAIRK